MTDLTVEETLARTEISLDRWEHTTVVAALIHYALAVAEPSECIRCLQRVMPEPKRPWFEIVTEARKQRAALDREVAAMREP